MIHLRWTNILLAACIAACCAGLPRAAAQEAAEAAAQPPDESQLIAVIQGDAGWAEKQDACRRLREIGTAQSVPALAALLGNAQLSHMARFALESMPCPEAGQALRDALKAVPLPLKGEMAASLGVRRDRQAVRWIAPLLKEADPDVVRTAAGALGRIATEQAARALWRGQQTAAPEFQPAYLEALLAAAGNFSRDGNEALAANLFRRLLDPEWPMYVRAGAFRGLADARPANAPRSLVAAMKGDEPLFRDMAADIVAGTSCPETTLFYAAALPKLPPAGQVAMLRGLAGRRDAAARPAAAQALNHADAAVRLAAVKALGVLGGPEDVPPLVALLSAEDAAFAEAAAVSLTTMRGAEAGQAVANAVAGSAPAVHAKLLFILANRGAVQTVPLAVEGLGNTEVAVRIAALQVLAPTGRAEQIPPVIAVLKQAADEDEKKNAEKTLNSMCARCGEPALPLVLDAMNGAAPEMRATLLGTAALVRGPKALETVVAALNDGEEPVRDKALNLLSNWPTLDAAPQLLELAKSEDASRYVLGLRGYVRLAQTEPAPEQRAAMLNEATAAVKRPDEMKFVLAAWGGLPTQQSLDVLRPKLDDPDVKNEAALAMITIATELAKRGDAEKARARDTLKAVLEKSDNPQTRESAERVLASLG